MTPRPASPCSRVRVRLCLGFALPLFFGLSLHLQLGLALRLCLSLPLCSGFGFASRLASARVSPEPPLRVSLVLRPYAGSVVPRPARLELSLALRCASPARFA